MRNQKDLRLEEQPRERPQSEELAAEDAGGRGAVRIEQGK